MPKPAAQIHGDSLYRFTFEAFGVRGEVVTLAASWRAVVERHDYGDAISAYLGQALAATTLLSGTIKFSGSLILQLQGDGPLRTLVAQATDRRMIRGMAHSEGDVPAGDIAAAIGQGRLVLTASAPNGERYQGIVELEGTRLSRVIEKYFDQSEQLPSRLWLAADKDIAAGLLLQRLPGGDFDEEDWRRVCILADTLNDDELLSTSPELLLRRLFHEEDVRLFEPEPVAFRCSCSRERVADTLRSLGRAELDDILAEQGAIETHCEFCNAHYRFDSIDVASLFSPAPIAEPPDVTQ
ncbi:Hsp33 family molecular chaperone HslO [Thiosocius teredinicola]|uniref:Hsp33 family molecular chaperone HslO n=1 Tax=Thiosocius teredinicola TaxID=1973002 RepID=UPI000990B311